MRKINKLITWLLTINLIVFTFINCFGVLTFEFFPLITMLHEKYEPTLVVVILELIASKVCIYFIDRDSK